MSGAITLDYRTCICRFDGMICTVDVTCPIHRAFDFAREDVEWLRRLHTDNCSMWWLSDYEGAQQCNCGGDDALSTLANRIEALLPPEAP